MNEYFPSSLCPNSILHWFKCCLDSSSIIFLSFFSCSVQMHHSRLADQTKEGGDKFSYLLDIKTFHAE